MMRADAHRPTDQVESDFWLLDYPGPALRGSHQGELRLLVLSDFVDEGSGAGHG